MQVRLFRTANFKFALLYVIVFSVSVFLLGIVVFLSGRHSLKEQLRDRIKAETAQLLSSYRNKGLEELRYDMKERIEVNSTNRLLYSLQNPNGRVAFDKIIYNSSPGWHQINIPDGGETLLLTVILEDGYLMTVAADMDVVTAIGRAVRNTFLLVFMLTLFSGMAGGVLVSQRFLSRVDRLTRTAESIGRGNLSERIPVSGAGDDFDQLVVTINQMLSRIERLMEDVQQVSTSIAHDLRTPLGKLRQKLESLQVIRPVGELQMICKESLALLDEILETFSALLRISEIRSGRFSAFFVNVEISKLLLHLAESYRPVAEEQSQRITTEIAAFLQVKGDRSLLTQLFSNLIENALRHTAPGACIHITLKHEKSTLIAEVCDNGPGIPAGERKFVIEPFYRLDRSRHTRGSGLGLSLVAAIATLHGASLNFEDNAPGLRVSVEWGRVGSL